MGLSEFFTAIRESAMAYPVILSIHLSAIALFGGAILITDLRLLSVALTDCPASTLIRQLRPWKQVGFVVMAASGILLAGAKAAAYVGNPYFQVKLILLALVGVHALVFRRRVYGEAGTSTPRAAKLAAYLSLALWLAIVSAGRLIAYY